MGATSVVLCFVFLCFMGNVQCTFGEFLMNLPTEIGNAFGTAWQSIKDAIKTPVKIKRLGPGGRRKTTPLTSTSTLPTTVSVTKDLQTVPKIVNKLNIPLLPTPLWRSFDDWDGLRRPRYSNKKKARNETRRAGNNDSFLESVRCINYDDWTKMQKAFLRRKRSSRYINNTCPSVRRAW